MTRQADRAEIQRIHVPGGYSETHRERWMHARYVGTHQGWTVSFSPWAKTAGDIYVDSPGWELGTCPWFEMGQVTFDGATAADWELGPTGCFDRADAPPASSAQRASMLTEL